MTGKILFVGNVWTSRFYARKLKFVKHFKLFNQHKITFMIPEYNLKSLCIGILGLIIQVAYLFLPRVAVAMGANPTARLPEWVAWTMLLTLLIGTILVIIGLGYYAKSKGYSAMLGLLGLLSWLGLIILAVLPDKMKQQSPKT
jgi:small-conductance mechanosensitive channel